MDALPPRDRAGDTVDAAGTTSGRTGPASLTLQLGDARVDVTHAPLVMGVLNRTVDSFYDRERHFRLDAFLDQADRLVVDGADILDVGARARRGRPRRARPARGHRRADRRPPPAARRSRSATAACPAGGSARAGPLPCRPHGGRHHHGLRPPARRRRGAHLTPALSLPPVWFAARRRDEDARRGTTANRTPR